MISNRISFAEPIIYLITAGATTPKNFVEESNRILKLVEIAAAVGISLIQIREKKIPARLVFELAREAARLAENTPTKILVNDRADIALAADAGGVHLTAKSLSAKIVRQSFPKDFLVGVSAHTLREAAAARNEGADFVTFSPVFETPSKAAYSAPQGVEKLRAVCEKLKPFPVLALGGINERNFQTVLENGASGFAAIRFLNDAETLPKIVERIKLNRG